MAFESIEAIKLAFQAHTAFSNLYRDMRENANAYKARITDPNWTTAQNIVIIQADNANYLKILGWLKAINDDTAKKAVLTLGSTKLGIPYQDWVDEYLALKDVCDTVAGSNLTTDAHITAAANYYINNTPELMSMWPNG